MCLFFFFQSMQLSSLSMKPWTEAWCWTQWSPWGTPTPCWWTCRRSWWLCTRSFSTKPSLPRWQTPVTRQEHQPSPNRAVYFIHSFLKSSHRPLNSWSSAKTCLRSWMKRWNPSGFFIAQGDCSSPIISILVTTREARGNITIEDTESSKNPNLQNGIWGEMV